jgi:hypothetical protein
MPDILSAILKMYQYRWPTEYLTKRTLNNCWHICTRGARLVVAQ